MLIERYFLKNRENLLFIFNYRKLPFLTLPSYHLFVIVNCRLNQSPLNFVITFSQLSFFSEFVVVVVVFESCMFVWHKFKWLKGKASETSGLPPEFFTTKTYQLQVVYEVTLQKGFCKCSLRSPETFWQLSITNKKLQLRF